MKYLTTILAAGTILINTASTFAEEPKVELHSAEQIISSLIDNDSTKYEELSIENGKLKVVPGGEGIGWFSDSQGAFLYKEITGDFMIETEVSIHRKDGKKGLPEANYSSAGLVVRDPASTYGNASWFMFNIGFQNRFYGREVKVTTPMNIKKEENPFYDLGMHSLSTLYLLPEANVEPMKLRIARIGEELRSYFFSNGKWNEQKPQQGMEVLGNGIKVPLAQFGNGQFRPNGLELPDKVQAGIVANPGMDANDINNLKRDGYALFSYFGIKSISSFNDALN